MAPEAVKVVDWPAQIVVVPLILTFKLALKVMVIVSVSVHPLAAVAVTV